MKKLQEKVNLKKMAAAQKKLYEDFFDKTDAMGQKDGNVSIQELKKMVVEGLGQKKTDQEIAVSIKSGGSETWRERGGKNMQTALARSHSKTFKFLHFATLNTACTCTCVY